MSDADISFKVHCGIIVREIRRAGPEVVRGLGELPTSILSDCLDRLNVLHSALRPVLEARPFAGCALTVEEIEAGNLMSHMALKYIQPGDVLVIDAKGITTRACWGGLQTLAAKKKGVAAVVIDGAVRDVDDIRRHDLPVLCRAVTPAGPHKGWAGRVNQPISCGGMVVQPGDVVVGDADGVVVVPREQAEETLAKARAKREMEKKWFAKLEEGVDTADFLGLAATAAAYRVKMA